MRSGDSQGRSEKMGRNNDNIFWEFMKGTNYNSKSHHIELNRLSM